VRHYAHEKREDGINGARSADKIYNEIKEAHDALVDSNAQMRRQLGYE
jgi:hypothetical protein